MFVLDTNTIIYFFKGIGQIAAHLLSVPPREVAIPTIVLYELEVGLAKSRSPKKMRVELGRLVASTRVLQFDRETARSSAKIRAYLEKKGRPIGPYDNLIAGTALAHNATLVTHNTTEFKRYPKLKVKDWY
jgi:tRNA(fMet)-specific endonuclease VapC